MISKIKPYVMIWVNHFQQPLIKPCGESQTTLWVKNKPNSQNDNSEKILIRFYERDLYFRAEESISTMTASLKLQPLDLICQFM